MERYTKRGLSLVLVLAMCISLLTGLSFVSNAATVEYVYGSYEGFTNVIYNWGTRGNTATFLSPNAEDYYEEKGTSYEELAALAGSANTASTPNSALYAELKELMTESMKINTSYGEARYLFPFTDCQNSNTSLISSFYDGAEYSNVWDSGTTYNREHVWPKSKLTNTSPSNTTRADSSDLMMLRPVTSSVNSSRGNTAYGEGAKYFAPNGYLGTTGYDIRGDVARTLLYGYVRWNNTAQMWGESGVIESLDILLDWIEADPVDTWEMGRNDSVESINGTRNVFVDYPELAFELFEQEVPEDMVTPSAGNSYKITAVSSNNARGSVNVAGNVIKVNPADGYEYAGYRVTSGTANVTVQGNALIVNAFSDCMITVDFQARSKKTVTFIANGEQVSTKNAYTGDTISLPDGALATLEGYTFAGWVTEEITKEITSAPAFYPAGAEYVVNANTRLYALFTRVGAGTGSSAATNYTLLTGGLTSGDYIITHENLAMNNSVKSSKLLSTAVSPSNGVINNPDASIIWTVTVNGTTATIKNAANGKYLQTAASGTNLTMNTTEATWNVIEHGNGTCDFQNPKVTTRRIRYNASASYFGNYNAENSNIIGAPLKLYKATSEASYYTTGNAAPQSPAVVEYWQDNELVGTFTTVEAALAEATEGTVVLCTDAKAGTVVVKSGVTLDLNGNTLNADSLTTVAGAIVCDGGATCTGGGLLKVAQGSLDLAKENGNGIIPVWNGEDGYVFTRVTFQQTTGTAAAGAANYIFLPSFSNAAAEALLADGGMDNELTIKVCLTWNNGYSQQFYTYSDDLVKPVYDGTARYAFDLTVNGISGITDLVASPIVATNSDTQATTSGTALTAN